MARTKLNQRSANRVAVPMGATGGRTPPSKWTVALLVVSILAAIWAAAMLTPFGRVGYYYFFIYSEYYMGVLTLVSLSITIMIGLVATDRLVLSIRQRVLLQSAHRTTGIIAVTSLVAHVWTKLMEQHIAAIDIAVPFLASYNRLYVGLGTLSGWVMVMVMWTGLARSKFIGRGKPWMWRSIHAVSYLMWPLALVHGLAAGRPAATWVIVSYVVCVLAVLVGLAVRLSVSLNRRKDFASTSQGTMKPVGSVVPTASPAPAARKPRRRERELEPVAAAPEQWRPATPRPPSVGPSPISPISGPSPISAMPSSAMPTSSRPGSGMPASGMPAVAMPAGGMPSSPISPMPYDEPRRGRRYAGEDEYDAPRRGRRYADEERAPRQRERYDEPTGAMSRRAIQQSRAMEDDPYRYAGESPRGRRRVAEDDEPRYEGRRSADAEPRSRSRRYADEDQYEAPRRRPTPDTRTTGELPRYEDEGADPGRHSRSQFVDLAPQADPWRVRADPNYMEPDDTPTLVDMASRRARRQAQQQGGSRRGRRGGEDLDDASYWRQLWGEAQ
jgi:hypothetical protein